MIIFFIIIKSNLCVTIINGILKILKNKKKGSYFTFKSKSFDSKVTLRVLLYNIFLLVRQANTYRDAHLLLLL